MLTKKFFTLEPCNSAKAYEIKFAEPIDLKKAEVALAKKYEILASTAVNHKFDYIILNYKCK